MDNDLQVNRRIGGAVDDAVITLDGDYWVLDGHNRVAAANALGQVFIDAEAADWRRGPGSSC